MHKTLEQAIRSIRCSQSHLANARSNTVLSENTIMQEYLDTAENYLKDALDYARSLKQSEETLS